MVEETIKSIRETENKADQIVKEAEQESKRILKTAKEETQAVYEKYGVSMMGSCVQFLLMNFPPDR